MLDNSEDQESDEDNDTEDVDPTESEVPSGEENNGENVSDRTNGSDNDSEDEIDGNDESVDEEDWEEASESENHQNNPGSPAYFALQDPKKISRIIRNLLSPLPVDKTKANREANRSIYMDICSILSIDLHESSKATMYNAIIAEVHTSVIICGPTLILMHI